MRNKQKKTRLGRWKSWNVLGTGQTMSGGKLMSTGWTKVVDYDELGIFADLKTSKIRGMILNVA